jgi:SWI/SNF-related matrix-associated actin-dependent regulator of chromatin subfamily A member 5
VQNFFLIIIDRTNNSLGKKNLVSKRKSSVRSDSKRASLLNDENSSEEKGCPGPATDYLLFQPKLLKNGTLMIHQLEALNWMIGLYNQDASGILADQMGLGKTIEVISMLAYLFQYQRIEGPHLVVCPLAVTTNWKAELDKWLPDCKSVILPATRDEREEVIKNVIKPRDFNVIITSYGGVEKNIKELKKIDWEYMVIDEAHRIKNENSILTKH